MTSKSTYKSMHQAIGKNGCALGITLVFATGVGCREDDERIEPDPAGADVFVEAGTLDARETACPEGLPGPKMASVPATGGGSYCMDSTEVTQAQYFAFLAAKGTNPMGTGVADMGGQPPQCKDNLKFTPGDAVDESPSGCRIYPDAYDDEGAHPDYPVGCVDWCDANAYCAWAGKRLGCGSNRTVLIGAKS